MTHLFPIPMPVVHVEVREVRGGSALLEFKVKRPEKRGRRRSYRKFSLRVPVRTEPA